MSYFSTVDYLLFAGYLIATVLVGVLFVKEQRTVKDYFLAGRSIGSVVMGLSVIAAMFSGISYLAMPGEIYGHGFAFAWGILSFFAITPFVTLVMLPLFYQSRFYTAYQYLEERFDNKVRVLASGLFILRVLLWLGAATYAPALALEQVTNIPLWVTILCTGLVTTVYTTLGGMKAVIWTDLLQLGVLFGGQLLIVIVALGKIPGGIEGVYQMASDAGRFKVETTFDPTARITLWTILLAAPLLNLVQLGTDQVAVQRYMTARSLRESKRGLWLKLWLFFPIGGLFFVTGLTLWAFYQQGPDPLATGMISKADRILPYFVVHELPKGFPGILIAAIYAASMSTVSAGLNSLSSATLIDFGRIKHGGSAAQEERHLRKAQILTVFFGILVTGLAFVIDGMGQTLAESVNNIIGLVGGPMVGLFLLGMLVPRANAAGAITGVTVGFGALVFFFLLGDPKIGTMKIPVGTYLFGGPWELSFMWYAMYGCIVTTVVGLVVSLCTAPPPDAKLEGLVWQRRPKPED
ncbi:MAG TPA: sodium/solute symporter [Prosthecobacter sp.]|nr:sodium/solute symporter [Prosthecobacter sp.]